MIEERLFAEPVAGQNQAASRAVPQRQGDYVRVSMVLEKSFDSPNYSCLIENREFTKVFSELMRRVEGLEEMLKMYNIELNACSED